MSDATDFPFGENAPAPEVASESSAPSAADLDAVAEEQKIAKATGPKKKAAKKAAPSKKSSPKKASTRKVATKKATPAKKTAKKQPKTAASTKNSNGQRGRTSQFAGKKLYKVAKENPRREGTHGYNSFKLIKDGMTYEQFIEKGGRLVDLVWDVEKGNVKVK